MEKKSIKVEYTDSGVNTLYVCGVLFFVLGIIFFIVSFIGLINFLGYSGRGENPYLPMVVAYLLYSLGSILGGAICRGLSSIARTALYQRTILEKEYEFHREK